MRMLLPGILKQSVFGAHEMIGRRSLPLLCSARQIHFSNAKMTVFKSPFPDVPLMDRPIADEVLEAIWKHGAEKPNKVAFITAETGKPTTYHELFKASLSVAAYLEKLDFRRGDLACAVLRNCWQYYPIFFGCALNGGGLSGASALFTDYELQQQFIDSKAKIVFCQRYSLETVQKAAKNCPQLHKIVVVESFDDDPNQPLPNSVEWIPVVPFARILRTQPTLTKTVKGVDLENDVVLLPYSSGTTGPPKGVMQGNKNYGTMIRQAHWHYTNRIGLKMDPKWDWRREHIQSVLPFYHNFGFSTTMMCLLTGATCVIIRKYEPEIFLKTIQDYKIRLIFMVPPMIVFLSKSPLVDKYNLSSLEFIQVGAAPLSREVIDMVHKRLPNLKQIGQGYGMTELSFGNHIPSFGEGNNQCSGKLISNCEMKVVHLETKKPLGVGETGEIYIKGPQRMIGYFGRPDATRDTFDEDGFVKTGDVGYVDADGYIYIVDRIKEMIKVKGYQVAPAELEALLLTFNKVRDVAVVGVPHERFGETPKAFIVRNDPHLTEAEVKEFVSARSAAYKHLHGGVEFIAEIPKSPSGKILRRQLRDLIAQKSKL